MITVGILAAEPTSYTRTSSMPTLNNHLAEEADALGVAAGLGGQLRGGRQRPHPALRQRRQRKHHAGQLRLQEPKAAHIRRCDVDSNERSPTSRRSCACFCLAVVVDSPTPLASTSNTSARPPSRLQTLVLSPSRHGCCQHKVAHLIEVCQEVGLILDGVRCGAQRCRPGARVLCHAGIVSRGHTVEAPGMAALQVLQEGAELDPAGGVPRDASMLTPTSRNEVGYSSHTLLCTHGCEADICMNLQTH